MQGRIPLKECLQLLRRQRNPVPFKQNEYRWLFNKHCSELDFSGIVAHLVPMDILHMAFANAQLEHVEDNIVKPRLSFVCAIRDIRDGPPSHTPDLSKAYILSLIHI